ncbi:glycosyltransferase [bacterium]|nr:glycosyltransferase [bacterium]
MNAMDSAQAHFAGAPAHRPRIAPVAAGADSRPLWSVMIPTHNCAKYLGETLRSVLAQAPDPGRMQIEVVDDCSTRDDPESVVREVGRGRVSFYRQPQNVGHTGNFATCLQRARGLWVHQLHGDDYVRDGFYAKMEAAFTSDPAIGAAFCRTIFADESGHWTGISKLQREESGLLPNPAEKLATRQCIQTPAIVVKREVYERLGGFDHRLSWTEDWEMWVRVAVNYPIWFEPEPLAVYRSHGHSSTSQKMLTGENVRDIGRCLSIFGEYFAAPSRHRILAGARRYYATQCVRKHARNLLLAGHPEAARKQVIEALKLSRGSSVLREVLFFFWLRLRVAARGR